MSWRSDWFYEHRFEHEWIPKTEGIRTNDWKYTEYPEESPAFEELFHLKVDEDETRNLATDEAYSGRLRALRERRQEWLTALAKWTPECDWAALEPAARNI